MSEKRLTPRSLPFCLTVKVPLEHNEYFLVWQTSRRSVVAREPSFRWDFGRERTTRTSNQTVMSGSRSRETPVKPDKSEDD